MYALVNGIVYFNYEVAQTLHDLSLYPPVNSCNYLGVDNEAEPITVSLVRIHAQNVLYFQILFLKLSLFFDILLPMCSSIDKEAYLNGRFTSNHQVPSNKLEMLNKIRVILWDALRKYKINLIQLNKAVKHVYLDSDCVSQRYDLFKEKSFISTFSNKSLIDMGHDSILVNCHFDLCSIRIGKNCFLNDLNWFSKTCSIADDLHIQQVEIQLESLSKSLSILIVFGIKDNLQAEFNPNDKWTIFNMPWSQFSRQTGITENDLWDTSAQQKNLFTAKLYPVFNLRLNEIEMNKLRDSFLNVSSYRREFFQEWSYSTRLSLSDIIELVNIEKIFLNRREISNKISIRNLIDAILKTQSINYNSIIKNIIKEGYANRLLDSLDEASFTHSNDTIVLSRLMAFISNTLCEMSNEFNLLRSGPYLNPQWLRAYEMIEDELVKESLSEMKRLRLNWMQRADLLLRASRHYEGAMQTFIRKAVGTCREHINLQKEKESLSFEWVEVRSPARLDLAGAWTDTPPICYESLVGSCVTNVAILINNQKPIGSRARIVKNEFKEQNSVYITIKDFTKLNSENDIRLKFDTLNDFKTYNRPQVVACLLKACLIYTKFIDLNLNTNLQDQLEDKINGSIEIEIWTNLPHGSGLGTSSILIGCVLLTLWKLLKIKPSDDKSLIYSVLLVEQLMTTNGGWQDQVGGLMGGFKFTQCNKGLPLTLDYEIINIDRKFENDINDRLVLIYTGISRLAKDLLLNVLRNWYTLSTRIFDNVQDLVNNCNKSLKSIKESNLEQLGACINCHRRNKLIMAPESEPKEVKKLISALEPYVYGIALAGAGGGGFLYALTKEIKQKHFIQNIINELNLNMDIYDAKISNDGFEFNFY